MAEEVRFELTRPCSLAVFKTAGINHYPTPPKSLKRLKCFGLLVPITSMKKDSANMSHKCYVYAFKCPGHFRTSFLAEEVGFEPT